MAEADVDTRRRRRSWALPTSLRWAPYVAIAVVLLLLAGAGGAAVVVRRSWPQTDGELRLPGLTGRVEVVRDSHGIPQIYADSLPDLMLAQGFVHAQERFFQMDLRRHATAGRLSELVGEAGLQSDLLVRTLGWRRVAQQELALLAPATREALDAYAEGVNAYLAGREPSEISLEYTLLGLDGLDYQPADWSAVDSIAWLKAMAWDLRGNLDDEIGRAMTIAAVGERRAAQLYPDYPSLTHDPIVTEGAVVDDIFEQNATDGGTRLPQRPPPGGPPRDRTGRSATEALARTDAALDAVPALLGRGDGIGSNAWAVAGERTASGAPILANDPHLGVSLPGVWMQVGLHCRSVSAACPMEVAGFSFAGVPGVVIGHNARIAWGFSNLGADVTDLFVERITGDRWQHGRRSRPLQLRTERIAVRDGEPVEITVRSTAHGPILSDLADRTEIGLEVRDAGGGENRPAGPWEYAVSLAWTALQPRPTADALLRLDLADDWHSFRSALRDLAAPGQNVVYADVDGHIGYQATGLVPIRKSGNRGLVPAAGWRPENDWTGQHVPYDALPNLLDPEAGMVVAANQAVIGPDYPYHLTDDWDRGYRSARIAELIGDRTKIRVADMAAAQCDVRHPLASVLTPYLRRVRLPAGYYAGGQRLLRTWDGDATPDSAAAAYFNVVWRQLLARTFHDELPEQQWPDGGQRWFAVVAELLVTPDAGWWDDTGTEGVVESRDDILAAALRDARDELTRRQSPNPREWRWGDLHRLELRSSALGRAGGAVERLVNRGAWPVGGGGSLVNATGWDAWAGYDVTTAPSMRMVVPMNDLDAARWINLTGVSGHAFHPHYTDQTDLLVRGDTLPWAFTRDAVLAAGEDTLTLVPE